jgi:hypothetical protein
MIVLCTDYGLSGPYTGQVKAALARAVPVIDLFADLPAFEPRLVAYLLAAYGAWLEPGDVVLAVVDPGVGGARGALMVEADGGAPGTRRQAARTRGRADPPFGLAERPRGDRLPRPLRRRHDRPSRGAARGRD